MKFLKTVQADLRERQIFPAVVLLAVLAVAIPIGASIELGKVKAPPPFSIVAPHVVLPKGVAPPARALAVLSATPVSQVARQGAEPNPFRQAGGSSAGASAVVSTSPTKTTTSTKATSTSTPTSTPVKSTPVTSTPAKSTPVKSTPPKTAPAKTTPAKTRPLSSKPKAAKPKPKSSAPATRPFAPVLATPTSGPGTLKATQAYSVNIDTKDAKGTHVLSNVVRLAPLPAAQSPEVIYLGVLKGGKKAAFLFTNSVKVSSQSASKLTCLPSPADCQIVELAPGQGMELAPTANTALIATFTFELVSIGAKIYPSANAATQAREAVSTAGQTLIPLSTSTELATLRFDAAVGALVHQTPPPSGATGSSGSTAATGTTGGAGATGNTSGNAQRLPSGVAFALAPAR